MMAIGKMMSPVLDQLAEDYKGKVIFAKVDIDQNPGLAMRFSVQGVPHFQVWKKGSKVEEFSGADRNQLQYLVKLHASDLEAPVVTFTTFPITSYALSEMTTQIQGVLKKTKEFNDGTALNETPQLRLDEAEFSSLSTLLERLSARDHTIVPTESHFNILQKFSQWPASIRVPALDIIRSCFAHPLICEHFLAPFVSKTPETDLISRQLAILTSESVTAIELRMLWRFVTNLLASEFLRPAVCNTEVVQSILTTMLKDINNDPPLRIYLCDALLNLVIALENSERSDEINFLLTKSLEVSIRLMTSESDENALCRLLVGLGTVVVRNPPFQMILCGNAHLKAFLEMKQKTCKVEHNIKAVTELLALLSKPL
jgi:thiol-disulfide isomerase/thioredoxin